MGSGEIVDWVCDDCGAHHFDCCACHAKSIGWEGDEMCERCFRSLVSITQVAYSLAYADQMDAIDVLKRANPEFKSSIQIGVDRARKHRGEA